MRLLRKGFLGGPPVPIGCLLLAVVALLALLGCGVVGFVNNVAPLAGRSYWAAQTATPRPTVTVFLGTTTPVYADTPVPGLVTTTPGVFVTETAQPPVTTTPSLPQIGFTTPEPTETPYYRVGAFYMNSDVYIGENCPRCLVFRVVGHETQDSPNVANATYHFLTVRVTNHGEAVVVVPASDLFFIRDVEQGGDASASSAQRLVGRWTAQNEPLIANGLPSYDAQQLDPLQPGESREYVIGFVVPDGEVRQLGLITNWNIPVEGGLPIWFYLENDPLGPFVDAHQPPPPTPILLDEDESFGGAIGTPGATSGRWPTTGTVTRGFGCHEEYTGIDGSGWNCPEEQPWFHNGVDVANATGTAIVSPVKGTMTYAGPNSTGADCSQMEGSRPPHEGLGNYQRVAGGGTVHYLGHLSSFAVTSGSVTAGQLLSGMGSTGCSTGPHLHWTVYQSGNLLDPALWAGPGP